MVVCSSKRKAQCHGPACAWIVGRGCRKATLQQQVARAVVAQTVVSCYKRRKAQCQGPACVWVVGRGCKKAHIPVPPPVLHAAAVAPLPRTPTPSVRWSATTASHRSRRVHSPVRSLTPVRRMSNRLYILNNAGNRVQNMTSLDNIPKEHAIKLDTQWYDIRYLKPWIQQQPTIPHSRRRITVGEYRRIFGHAPPARLGLLRTPQEPAGIRIRRWLGMPLPIILNRY